MKPRCVVCKKLVQGRPYSVGVVKRGRARPLYVWLIRKFNPKNNSNPHHRSCGEGVVQFRNLQEPQI